MHKLAVVDHPRVAQSFVDYMASRGFEVKMMPEPEGRVALWFLGGNEHIIEVEHEFELFANNSQDRKYQAASWNVAESRTATFNYSSPSLMNMVVSHSGPVTLTVMTLCIVIFSLQLLGFSQPLFLLMHFPTFADQQWQLWRLFSHALLHFSVTHIAFNLLWWWQLGGEIENKVSRNKLLQLFLFSALFSGLGQYWVEGANFGGLSGVVYALLGYIWITGTLAPERDLSIGKPIIAFMLIWLVLGFVQPFMAIANTAHLVGLLCGCLLAWFDNQRKRTD
jgi:GlpG protein